MQDTTPIFDTGGMVFMKSEDSDILVLSGFTKSPGVKDYKDIRFFSDPYTEMYRISNADGIKTWFNLHYPNEDPVGEFKVMIDYNMETPSFQSSEPLPYTFALIPIRMSDLHLKYPDASLDKPISVTIPKYAFRQGGELFDLGSKYGVYQIDADITPSLGALCVYDTVDMLIGTDNLPLFNTADATAVAKSALWYVISHAYGSRYFRDHGICTFFMNPDTLYNFKYTIGRATLDSGRPCMMVHAALDNVFWNHYDIEQGHGCRINTGFLELEDEKETDLMLRAIPMKMGVLNTLDDATDTIKKERKCRRAMLAYQQWLLNSYFMVIPKSECFAIGEDIDTHVYDIEGENTILIKNYKKAIFFSTDNFMMAKEIPDNFDNDRLETVLMRKDEHKPLLSSILDRFKKPEEENSSISYDEYDLDLTNAQKKTWLRRIKKVLIFRINMSSCVKNEVSTKGRTNFKDTMKVYDSVINKYLHGKFGYDAAPILWMEPVAVPVIFDLIPDVEYAFPVLILDARGSRKHFDNDFIDDKGVIAWVKDLGQ